MKSVLIVQIILKAAGAITKEFLIVASGHINGFLIVASGHINGFLIVATGHINGFLRAVAGPLLFFIIYSQKEHIKYIADTRLQERNQEKHMVI